jgi:dihydropyrimidinase
MSANIRMSGLQDATTLLRGGWKNTDPSRSRGVQFAAIYTERELEMVKNGFDTVVLGGTVVSGHGQAAADIGITDGKVEVIARGLSRQSAAHVIDASGKLVLPGVIDAHNHPVYDDDVEGTSISAVHGGVTTLIPFIGPNPAWGLPATKLVDTVKPFIEQAEANSVVDFGIHGVVIGHDDVVPQIPALVEMGVISIKFFMAYKKRGMMMSDDEILRVMDALAANGAIAMIHAENGGAIDYLTDKLSGSPKVDNEAFIKAHRDLLEAEAIFRAVALAESVGCPLYIPHVAVKEGVDILRPLMHSLPMPLFLETCPHYLVLTNDEVLRRGPLAKIGPPIRERHDNNALWEGLRDGVIEVIGTDHASIHQEKKMMCNHILDARFGAPGIEYLLTLTYSEGVRKNRIGLGRMVNVLCENPAKIFGLYPRKGALVPGADADLVVFDPEKRQVCSAETQHGKSDYCLFEGMETVGAPILVMQRGKVLVENGTLLAKPGEGKYLPAFNPIWD